MVGLGQFGSVHGQFGSVEVSLLGRLGHGRFMVDSSQFGSVHGQFGSACVGSWSGWVGSW